MRLRGIGERELCTKASRLNVWPKQSNAAGTHLITLDSVRHAAMSKKAVNLTPRITNVQVAAKLLFKAPIIFLWK